MGLGISGIKILMMCRIMTSEFKMFYSMKLILKNYITLAYTDITSFTDWNLYYIIYI